MKLLYIIINRSTSPLSRMADKDISLKDLTLESSSYSGYTQIDDQLL